MGFADFRCHHCVNVIEEGMPVYMCQDACYCSVSCRKRGRSVEYAKLTGLKLEETPDNVSMYSSIVSDSTATSSKRTDGPPVQGHGGHGMLRWILSAGMRQLTAIAGGAELLRMGSFASPRFAWCQQVAEDPAAGADMAYSCEGFMDMAVSEHDKGSCADFVRLIEGNA